MPRGLGAKLPIEAPTTGTASEERPTRIAEGREAEIFAWDEHRVLRLYRDPGASGLADRGMVALAAVRAALPSVPAPHERMDRDGRPGLLMERLDGHGVLLEIQRRPWRVATLAKLCGRDDDEAVLRWKRVRAVERLADRIPEERTPLLREAERRRRALRARPGVTF